MGGKIYILLYVRYLFYDQMIAVMNYTNTKLRHLNSAASCNKNNL